jgi:hypothetical protein
MVDIVKVAFDVESEFLAFRMSVWELQSGELLAA